MNPAYADLHCPRRITDPHPPHLHQAIAPEGTYSSTYRCPGVTEDDARREPPRWNGVRGVDPVGTRSSPPNDDLTLADVQQMIARLDRADRAMLRPWMLAHYDEHGDERPQLPRST